MKTAPWSPQEKMLQVVAVQGWATDHTRIVLQVDLGLLRFVTAVGTQGAISKETKKKYYVKTYRIDISSNGEDWVTIKEGNKPVVSLAATGSTTSVFEMDDQLYLFVWELSVWPSLFFNWFKMKSAIKGLNLPKGSHVPRSRSQKQITWMWPRKSQYQPN